MSNLWGKRRIGLFDAEIGHCLFIFLSMLNHWYEYMEHPEQVNRLNSCIINRHKMHRNRYNRVKSCLTFMFKGNQLCNSLAVRGQLTTAGTAIVKEQADAQWSCFVLMTWKSTETARAASLVRADCVPIYIIIHINVLNRLGDSQPVSFGREYSQARTNQRQVMTSSESAKSGHSNLGIHQLLYGFVME